MVSNDNITYTFKVIGGTEAQNQITGLASRFVGLNTAVGLASKAINTSRQWVEESIESYRSFEKKIREISTILTTENKDAIYGLQSGIESLSMAYGKSADDLAEGMYEILSAAFESSDAMNLLDTSTKAAIAGLTSVKTSVDVFTTILNTYGMSVEQATYLSDQLFETVVRGKLRFEDLASALGYVVPIAANAGIEFEEIAAVLSTVTRMGLHVDMASRGLALGIQNIVDPTKEASEAAQKYGVDMSAVALQVKGLEGFIIDLNDAMKEHGSVILPEMITNMRSLRVFMALASEEGVSGFIEDLGLLQKSAGLTEEALASMMLASQTQADIVTQHMEALNRSVGESWSGFDIWWKKTQLWWGTLFSGGDANKTLNDLDDQLKNITLSSLNLLFAQTKLSQSGTTWNQVLTSGVESLNIDVESIDKYFKKTEELNSEIKKSAQYANAGALLSTSGINKMGNNIERNSSKAKELNDILSKFGLTLDDLGDIDVGIISDPFGNMKTVYSDAISFEKIINSINNTVSLSSDRMIELNNEISALKPTFDDYISAFDTATQEIQQHEFNLLSLTNTIRDLKIEVENTYETLGSRMNLEGSFTFIGKGEYQIELAKAEMMLSRSQQFTNMAMKYGKEYINEYNEAMRDDILTIYDYEESIKSLNDTLDIQNHIMDYNNIKILELQIKGMERRRGLLRSEEKQIKSYELENARARLINMQTQYDNENDVQDDSYDIAKDNIQEWFDNQSHYIYLMKDVREDEIRDMEENYSYQKTLLSTYTGYYEEEMTSMITKTQLLGQMISSIAPELIEDMEDMFGDTQLNMLIKYNEQLREAIMLLNASKVMPEVDFEPIASNLPTVKDIFNQSLPSTILLNNLKTRLGLPLMQTGGYVERTGAAIIHKGETVTPAGHSGVTQVNMSPITINANITGDTDLEKLGGKIGRLISAGIIKGITIPEVESAYLTGKKILYPLENEFRVG